MKDTDFDIGVLKPIGISSDTLVYLIILFCFVLLALSRADNYNYISNLFKVLFNRNHNNKYFSLKSRSSYLLTMNFFIVFSLFINHIIFYQSNFRYYYNIPTILIVIFCFIILIFIRQFISYLLAKWFNRSNYFDVFNMIYFYQIVGVLLLPIICVGFFYTNQVKIYFFSFSLILILTAYVYFLIKSFRVALQLRISLLYIILYLCTLEILPILFIERYLLS